MVISTSHLFWLLLCSQHCRLFGQVALRGANYGVMEPLFDGKKREQFLCLSSGECSVTGDMYFHSFDGRVYTFAAPCQYVLAKSRSSGKFTVTIQNAPCGAVSHVLSHQASL